jgi:transcriptional regulator with XRE-family HTH domain
MSRRRTPFAQRLRQARERRELSQMHLAQMAGLPQSAVSHFESGARAPSLHNFLRLADVLGVTTDFLLGRSVGSLRAAGPLVHRLLQALEGMPIGDMELLVDVATLMAKRHTQAVGGDGQAVSTCSQQDGSSPGEAQHLARVGSYPASQEGAL